MRCSRSTWCSPRSRGAEDRPPPAGPFGGWAGRQRPKCGGTGSGVGVGGTRRPHRSLGSEFVAPRRPWPEGSRPSKPRLVRRIQRQSAIGSAATTSEPRMRRDAGRARSAAREGRPGELGPPGGAHEPFTVVSVADPGVTGVADAGASARRAGDPSGWTVRPVRRGPSGVAVDAEPGPSWPGGRAGPRGGGNRAGSAWPGGRALSPGAMTAAASSSGPARARPVAVPAPASASPTVASTSTSASHPDSRQNTMRVPVAPAISPARPQARSAPSAARSAAASAARSAADSARCRASTAAPMWSPIISAPVSAATAPAAHTVARPSSASALLMAASPRSRRPRRPARRSATAGATRAAPTPRR